jgi:electron transfer flavoprotein alpha subunit
MSNIVVIAEVRGGACKRPSLEAVTAALPLAKATGGKVVAIACGSGLDAACAELGQSGVHQVVAIEGAAFANYSGDGYAKAIAEQCKALGASAVLMAHTAMGKDLLPRVSALLDASVLTDIVAVGHEGGAFTAKKPVFAGKATMLARAAKLPFCATLRPNNFAAACGSSSAPVQKVAAPAGDLLAVVKEIVAAAGGKTPLQEAKVVVSGGRGLKEAQHFKLIEDLAAAFRSARPARWSARRSTSRSASAARSSTSPACAPRARSSRSTRTPTRRSSRSPISASSGMRSKWCRR